jgi:hypothetical protein
MASYYDTPDAREIAADLIALIDPASPGAWDRLEQVVRRLEVTPHAGWREDRDIPLFGGDDPDA